MKPFILVDGSSYFFRAFHALPPLTTSKGQHSGAIYGVANMIKRLIKDYQPDQIAVIFDAKGKTFRDDWYPEYKANRKAMPVELSSQFEPLLAVLKAMGLPLLIIPGVEADDVIGTLTKKAVAEGLPVLISTGDKDMAQLVNDKVSLINTMSNQLLDPAGVEEKFGVKPEQICDYLSLIGDSSDNVPGVDKCGPKTAVKWLKDYKTLDNLVAHADEIGGKIGESLRAGLSQIPLWKKLITIKTDVELPLRLSDLKPQAADKAALIELTREYEFRSWLKDLLSAEVAAEVHTAEAPTAKNNFQLIQTAKQLDDWITTIQNHAEFSMVCKASHSNIQDLAGIAMALSPEQSAYIPINAIESQSQLSKETIMQVLKPIMEATSIKKIGHNLKQDYHCLEAQGITLRGIAYDVMLESYILNSGAARHDLESLSLKYLGHKTQSYAEIAGTGSKQLSFPQIAVDKAAAFAIEEALNCLALHQKLYSMMDSRLLSVFNEIEMPLLTVLAEIESQGVLIDEPILFSQGERLKAQIKSLEQEAWDIAGKNFNLSSPKQLQDILFLEQGLPIVSKTPKGQASTAESVLQELAYEYRLPAVILEYRSLSKLVSTYIDSLPKRINPLTGRVHTHYNQAVTATGRLSSTDPNLQNIPVRSEEGRMIRQAFIAPEGSVILAADYSQIELRIMAHLSQDPALLKAFHLGLDIHSATASEIFAVPLEEVTKEQRRSMKAVNFGLIYGMSSFGLAKQLGISREDAQSYIDRYFLRYPAVLEYMERTRKQAHQQGYVETIYGRRLYLPEINAQNLMRQKAAERTAINAPMQGSAADIIKKAMLSIAAWEQQQPKRQSSMIMQVHDELVFEIRKEALEECQAKIRQLMEHCLELCVPILVSIGIGSNWDQAH